MSATRPTARRSLMLNFALVFILGLFVARLPATLAMISGTDGTPLERIADVQRLISNEFVDAPDAAKLQKGAIDGMLEALDDPYAEYIPPADSKEFTKQMTGEFVGIGCQIEMRDGWLTVVAPLEDSPALAAGILSGDRITKIGDKSTFGLTSDECIKMLTGEPGTPVTFTVLRDGQTIPYTLNRARIVSKSVRGVSRLPDGSGHWDFVLDPKRKIAFIRLSQFTPTSPIEFAEALESAADAMGGEINGLIIDLRFNPGGVMEAALQIADMFVESGTLLSVRGRNQPPTVFNAHGPGTLPEFPVAILVNGASASASEIVSGALADHNRAVIVGTRTFGKGLVQTVLPLPHEQGGQVKFTTQRYYLPSGRLIQRSDDSTTWGVDPTLGFYIPMTDSEQLDAVLRRRAFDALRGNHAAAPADAAPAAPAGEAPPAETAHAAPAADDPATLPKEQHWNDPAWVREHGKDRQLAAAVQAMLARVDAGPDGQWAKVSDEPDQNAKISVTELHNLEKARDRMSREFARLDKRIETLESATASGKPAPSPASRNFWSDTIDLTGGKVQVFDKDGKPVAELKITGRDLERWLAVADVESEKPADAPTPTPTPASTPAEPASK